MFLKIVVRVNIVQTERLNFSTPIYDLELSEHSFRVCVDHFKIEDKKAF